MKTLFIFCSIFSTISISYAQCRYQGNAYNVGTVLTIDGVKKKCSCIDQSKKNYENCASQWVDVTPPPPPPQPPRPQAQPVQPHIPAPAYQPYHNPSLRVPNNIGLSISSYRLDVWGISGLEARVSSVSIINGKGETFVLEFGLQYPHNGNDVNIIKQIAVTPTDDNYSLEEPIIFLISIDDLLGIEPCDVKKVYATIALVRKWNSVVIAGHSKHIYYKAPPCD